jgi:hypothetical protein
MEITYQINSLGGVIRLPDYACIPEDERNADWRDYLAWVDAGNTPLPAPEATPEAPAAATSSTTGEDTFSGGVGVAGALYVGEELSTGRVAVAALPPPQGRAGARYFVIDSNVGAFGSVVAGGGAIMVPVYSDGIEWRVG